MQLIEALLSSIKSIYAYKMRSLLTMLGIIIGISSVIMITSIGDGVYNAIYEELGQFNLTAIEVFPRNLTGPPVITINDKEALLQLHNVTGVTAVTQLPNQEVSLRVPGEFRRGMVWGIDHNYYIVQDIDLLYGRFFIESDINNNSLVAIISLQTSLDIFGMANSVGHIIEATGEFGRYSLNVIGVLDIPQETMGMQTPIFTDMFLIPFTTASILRNYPERISTAILTLENPTLSTATADQIVRLLNFRHDLENGFTALSYATMMEGMDVIFTGIIGFIAFVAGISLFVGGVGVMNIMMVTVTERTREIGIKKSLGATGVMIRMQFLLEAVLLTSIGGIFGIVSGIASARGLSILITMLSPMNVISVIDTNAILIALTVSMTVGIVFGVYPAAKAAKLDPVDSLRYE